MKYIRKQQDTLGQIVRRDCKGIKYNPSLGQITGLQKNMDMACTHKHKKRSKRQNEPREVH
jgi:hypothetical protein